MDALINNIINLAAAKGGDESGFRAALHELLNGYHIEPAKAKRQSNAQALIKRFIGAKRIEGLSDKTLKNYKIYLCKFAAEVDKNIQRITADDIRAYIGAQTLNDNSIQTVLNILRSFFGWLTREEIIKKNPTLKIPSSKKPRKRLRKAMSVEALERLRNACETTREKALVEFLYSTGCRISEVSSIALADVDFNERSVRVVGKGDQERVVYFSVRAMLLLLDYVEGRPASKALFANVRAPHGAMSPRSIEKTIHQLGENARLNERVFPHLLRHTFATISLNNGMDITIIQRLLGHRQLSTTQVYAEISQANVRHEYERCVS